MRADRILGLLLLLQARGQMTARQLATELEVSERTIYRDIDALTLAGIPIYAEVGQGGGYGLVDAYRTDLTGMTLDELRAILSLSIPAPLQDLGIADDLRSALRKLTAATACASDFVSLDMQRRIHVDSTSWFHNLEPVPHLQTIHGALWDNQLLQVSYRVPYAPVTVSLRLAPYGLVAKGGAWHLVCCHGERIRVYAVSDLVAIKLRPETFVRPPGFDLARFWQSWCKAFEQGRPILEVVIRVMPEHREALTRIFGTGTSFENKMSLRNQKEKGILTLSFSSFEEARSSLLSYGGAVEVLSPASLRLAMIDYAEQILRRYEA